MQPSRLALLPFYLEKVFHQGMYFKQHQSENKSWVSICPVFIWFYWDSIVNHPFNSNSKMCMCIYVCFLQCLYERCQCLIWTYTWSRCVNTLTLSQDHIKVHFITSAFEVHSLVKQMVQQCLPNIKTFIVFHCSSADSGVDVIVFWMIILPCQCKVNDITVVIVL